MLSEVHRLRIEIALLEKKSEIGDLLRLKSLTEKTEEESARYPESEQLKKIK